MQEENKFEEVTIDGTNVEEKQEASVEQSPEPVKLPDAQFEEVSQGDIKESVAQEAPVEPVVSEEAETVRDLGEQPVKDTSPEVSIEKVSENKTTEATKQKNLDMPEGIDKVIEFVNSGGTLEEYVNLNRDLDKLDPTEVVKEYYRQENPQMSEERLARKMSKAFDFDEDFDEDDIQDKKDLFEDELYKAKQSVSQKRDKFYTDVRQQQAGASVEDQQKQVQLVKDFTEKTAEVFDENFNGFVFDLGANGGKVRYKIDNANSVKESQLNINNFIGEYLGDDGILNDAKGYHKALWAARNHDKIASLAYEQGRADTIKGAAKDSKNISMDPSEAQSSAGIKKAAPGTFEEVEFSQPRKRR